MTLQASFDKSQEETIGFAHTPSITPSIDPSNPFAVNHLYGARIGAPAASTNGIHVAS